MGRTRLHGLWLFRTLSKVPIFRNTKVLSRDAGCSLLSISISLSFSLSLSLYFAWVCPMHTIGIERAGQCD